MFESGVLLGLVFFGEASVGRGRLAFVSGHFCVLYGMHGWVGAARSDGGICRIRIIFQNEDLVSLRRCETAGSN